MRVTSEAAALNVKAALLLILSVVLLPLSVVKATVGVAIVLSSVKVKLADEALPAMSVSVTTTVWLPSAVGAV